METKEKLRSEIEEKYKWDLTTIYQSDAKWNEDYKKAQKEIIKINNYKDTFLSNAKSFYEFLIYNQETDRLLNKLYYYSHLNYDGDTTNDHYKKMNAQVVDLIEEYEKLSSFVIPTILKQDYSLFEKFYKEDERLLDFKFSIEEVYRNKKHTLDEDKELMIATISPALSGGSRIFESLTDSDMEFDDIELEDGKKVNFNESNYSVFISSKNREVRKRAFEILLGGYSKYKNTLASCYANYVDTNISLSKIYNYDNALSASLFPDNVDESIYKNLIKTVNNRLDVLYRYYDIKKKVLNLDEFHLYDVYANLVDECDKNYTFEEAKELVLKALKPLGDEYQEVLNKAFNERWIDIYHNKGKTSGAYSSGFYDTNPYILLNFEGKLNDVSTLAHELGHSMHTYFSCKNNPYQYSSYKIFVAEVASTVNELLLSNYMLKNSNNKEEKLNIINHILELFKSTIYRQTMFAEFELLMHQKREEKEVLTSTFLTDNYYNIVKKYFGKNVVCDDLIKYEWSRIPHFYYDFYVYKYATSLSAACYIVTCILNNEKDALNNYLRFLSMGGSDYPVNELKKAGVDMTDSKVIDSAIDMFSDYLDKFEEIYNS